MTHARGTAVFYEAMEEILGLIALAGYILAIIGLAAGITYVVIRIFPTEREPKKKEGPEREETRDQGSSKDAPKGSLFRRSKREKQS